MDKVKSRIVTEYENMLEMKDYHGVVDSQKVTITIRIEPRQSYYLEKLGASVGLAKSAFVTVLVTEALQDLLDNLGTEEELNREYISSRKEAA